jgi:hypothetical protein
MTNRNPAVANVTSSIKEIQENIVSLQTQQTRSFTISTDTPTSEDIGKLIIINRDVGGATITINSSLGLSAGQRIDFLWNGFVAAVTFSGSGVTLNGTPGLKLRARYSAATLVCLSSNNYVLIGDLSA